MSTALAIAAVTDTLRNLLVNALHSLQDILPPPEVTVQPPDKAHEDQRTHFVNLFLYQVLPNAAWRNMDIPQRVRSGETAMPPLALNLYYMLTAYSQGDNVNPPATSTFSHRLLGRAMSALYDNALLLPGDIAQALPQSELQNQVERVRITLQPLTVEEIFRLWSGFQSQYRISVAYEVSVVLIESTQPTKTPLPVLTRGQKDSGISSQANLTPPFPTIEDVVLPHPPSALLKDDLTLKGHNLLPNDSTLTIQVRFTNPRWKAPVDLDAKSGTTPTASEITVTLPDRPKDWPAGFYTLSVVFKDATPAKKVVQTSNEVPFSLAPLITLDPPTIVKDGHGTITKVTIHVKCSPGVQPGQRVALLFADREVLLTPPLTATTQQLAFEVGTVAAGEYFVRLRVDGVDSLLVDRTVSPPKFDQSQKVTIS